MPRPRCTGRLDCRASWAVLAVAQNRQLADVVAGFIGPQVALRFAVSLADADGPRDDHDQLVAEVALANQRLAGGVQALLR